MSEANHVFSKPLRFTLAASAAAWLLCLIAIPVQAEIVTYEFSGNLQQDWPGVGTAAAGFTGSFTYDTQLPPSTTFTPTINHGRYENPTVPTILPSFTVQYSEATIEGSMNMRLSMFDDHSLYDDTFVIDGFRLSSPTISIPLTTFATLMFRDKSRSVFNSTIIPGTLPPLRAFDFAILNYTGTSTGLGLITTLTKVPEPTSVVMLMGLATAWIGMRRRI